MDVGGHRVMRPGQPLGRGGFGVVWEARHRTTGAPVALKVATHPSWREPEAQASFRHEVRAIGGLDHPAIPRPLDIGRLEAPLPGTDPGAPWMLLELGRGTPLTARPPVDVSRVALELLDGLAHAHGRGLVHGDISPANVLVGADRVRLVDFGLARPAGTPDGPTVVGTLPFMAPEQRSGQWRDVGPWTDGFAVGALVWWLLTGTPVERLPIEDAHEVPESWRRWLRRALEPRTMARFATAAEAARALPVSGMVATTSPVGVTQTLSAVMRPAGTAAPGPAAVLDVVVPPDWRGPVRRRSVLDMRLGAASLWGLADPPLVGREALRDRLWAALGRSGAVMLTGPSGVGKSRLARWLIERATELGVAVGWRVDPGSEPAALAAAVLGTRGLAGPARAARVRTWLGAHGAEVPVAEVEALLDGARRPDQLGDLLASAARGRVAVLWLDDAPQLLEWLELCAPLVGRVPRLLVIATARSESIGPHAAELLEAFEEIGVGPLPIDAQTRFVRSLLAVSPGLGTEVVERTAGNPLFATQLLQSWLEQGLLDDGPEGLIAAGPLPPPEGLVGVWRRRLEGVSGDLGLDVAAAMGVEVDRVAWREVTRSVGGDSGDALWRVLAERHLVDDDGRRARFVHGLAWEAACERSRERGTWVSVQRAWATFLERESPEPPTPSHQLRLGVALAEGGDREAGAATLATGAALLTKEGRFREALRTVEQARAVADAAGLPMAHAVREQLAATEVSVVAMTGRHADAVERGTAALVHAHTPRVRVDLLRMMSYAHGVLGEEHAARECLAAAVAEAEQGGVSAGARSHLQFQEAALLTDHGRYAEGQARFEALAERFVEVAPDLVALTLTMACVNAAFRGATKAALQLGASAVDQAQAAGLLHASGHAHAALGYSRLLVGDATGAADSLRDARGAFDTADNPAGVAMTRRLEAGVLRERGALDEARDLLLDVLPVLDRLDPEDAVAARLDLACVLAATGDRDGARAHHGATTPVTAFDKMGAAYVGLVVGPAIDPAALDQAVALRVATGAVCLRSAACAALAAEGAPGVAVADALRREAAALRPQSWPLP